MAYSSRTHIWTLVLESRVWSIQETSFELQASAMLPTYVDYNSLFQVIKLHMRSYMRNYVHNNVCITCVLPS